MLYRCRWCERAYCEDCLDFDKGILIGNGLPEYANLGFEEQVQAFYVQCAACTDHLAEHPIDRKLCDNLARDAQLEYKTLIGVTAETSRESRSVSLTDATTIETPGINTGYNTTVFVDDGDDEFEMNTRKKRKLKLNFGVI